MLIPDRNLLLLAALWLGLGILTAFEVTQLWLWQATGMVLLAAMLADAYAARSLRGLVSVQRELAHSLPVGTLQTVHLRLTAEGAVAGWLTDAHPPSFETPDLPLAFSLQPNRWLRLAYRARLTERGPQQFGEIMLRLRSPLRLWLSTQHAGGKDTVRVYPDFARVTQYTLLASDDRLSQMGVLRRQRRGTGLEFQQLRDYRQDDSPRQIDWKASARSRKLISREYEDERDQQIVFLLDCGQRMRARDDTLSHFDHALNAVLLLAYVALRQGDAVGLSSFAHAEPRFVPPRKSIATVSALLNTVYDLQPSLETPDYLAAAAQLGLRLSRRAMVVIVTNLRDEDDDTLRPALAQLRRKHLVLLASLKESVLELTRNAPIANFEEALTHAAAIEYSQSRARQLALLRQSGVQILDVEPAQLPLALINRYWALKREGKI